MKIGTRHTCSGQAERRPPDVFGSDFRNKFCTAPLSFKVRQCFFEGHGWGRPHVTFRYPFVNYWIAWSAALQRQVVSCGPSAPPHFGWQISFGENIILSADGIKLVDCLQMHLFNAKKLNHDHSCLSARLPALSPKSALPSGVSVSVRSFCCALLKKGRYQRQGRQKRDKLASKKRPEKTDWIEMCTSRIVFFFIPHQFRVESDFGDFSHNSEVSQVYSSYDCGMDMHKITQITCLIGGMRFPL